MLAILVSIQAVSLGGEAAHNNSDNNEPSAIVPIKTS